MTHDEKRQIISDGELACLPIVVIDQLSRPIRERAAGIANMTGRLVFRGTHLNFRLIDRKDHHG